MFGIHPLFDIFLFRSIYYDMVIEFTRPKALSNSWRRGLSTGLHNSGSNGQSGNAVYRQAYRECLIRNRNCCELRLYRRNSVNIFFLKFCLFHIYFSLLEELSKLYLLVGTNT